MFHVLIIHKASARKSTCSWDTERGKSCARGAHSGSARVFLLRTSLFKKHKTQEALTVS